MNPALVAALIDAQPHAVGTVDRDLLGAQTLLTSESRAMLYSAPTAGADYVAGSRSALTAIVEQVTGGQRGPFAKLVALTRWCSRIPRDYPTPEASTAAGFYGDFSAFRWGGDEEAVIAKGSPWPQELARVLATLAQLAGTPARLVFLCRTEPAELHCVVEAWLDGRWVVFDPCANRFYPWPHRGFASALDLQQQPKLVDQTPEHGRIHCVDSTFYRTIGIVSYPVSDREQYRYDQQPTRPDDLPFLRHAAEGFARQ